MCITIKPAPKGPRRDRAGRHAHLGPVWGHVPHRGPLRVLTTSKSAIPTKRPISILSKSHKRQVMHMGSDNNKAPNMTITHTKARTSSCTSRAPGAAPSSAPRCCLGSPKRSPEKHVKFYTLLILVCSNILCSNITITITITITMTITMTITITITITIYIYIYNSVLGRGAGVRPGRLGTPARVRKVDHRWNGSLRPQPQKFSKLVSLI